MLARVVHKVMLFQATSFTSVGKNVISPFFLWTKYVIEENSLYNPTTALYVYIQTKKSGTRSVFFSLLILSISTCDLSQNRSQSEVVHQPRSTDLNSVSFSLYLCYLLTNFQISTAHNTDLHVPSLFFSTYGSVHSAHAGI